MLENQAYMQGIYTSLAVGAVLSRNVHFPKEPIRFFSVSEEKEEPECHERMAADEMAVWIHALKKQGLKETKFERKVVDKYE